jgi:membrane protease YdiL (CAAX protease family)
MEDRLTDPLPGTTNMAVTTPDAQYKPVAPAWHTVVFIAIIVVVAVLARSQGDMIAKHGRFPAYYATMVWEWALVLFIYWGIRRKNVSMSDLVEGRWSTGKDFGIDVAVALCFWFASGIVLALVSHALRLTSAAQLEQAKKDILPLLPTNGREMAVWVALSVTAGICEEIMFRGYLQRQFRALMQSEAGGVVLQAVLFGCAHGYQGGRRMVLIGIYGVMFGALASWRKNLRPGMIAHTLQDSISGIASRLLK